MSKQCPEHKAMIERASRLQDESKNNKNEPVPPISHEESRALFEQYSKELEEYKAKHGRKALAKKKAEKARAAQEPEGKVVEAGAGSSGKEPEGKVVEAGASSSGSGLDQCKAGGGSSGSVLDQGKADDK